MWLAVIPIPGSGSDTGSAGIDFLAHWLPFLLTSVVAIGWVWLADVLLLRRAKLSLDQRLPRQITMLVLTIVAIIVVVLSLPGGRWGVSEQARGQLLGLIGLSVTALITLSSTTLAANAMAGLMLRATARYRGGDWVRVGEYFGRVTERGLFHTEIQTEDRDLMSLPNLYLATNPVRIVQEKGTVVSAEVSLGYDVPHDRAEELLMRAAEQAGLVDPFVWVTDLKDHAVVYRAAGVLEEVKGLISVRSRLRVCILDKLHGADVEVATPGLVIQRRGELGDRSMPRAVRRPPVLKPEGPSVEERVFDKAEQAARVEGLTAEREAAEKRLAEIKVERKGSGEGADTAALDAESARVEARLEEIKAELESPPDEPTPSER